MNVAMNKGSVLVVEDEVVARDALVELLRDEGFRVEAVTDGVAAWERVLRDRPDVVLTDLRMPRMDGFELTQRVRAHDPRIGVVVMTADDAPESAEAAVGAGASQYLQKPVRLRDLVAALVRELARRRR